MTRGWTLPALCGAAVILSGCTMGSRTTVQPGPNGPVAVQTPVVSPLVGAWVGKAELKDKGIGALENQLKGGPLTGPCSLTLNADGSGFLKVADKPERPVNWKQNDKKIILEPRDSSTGESLATAQWVATVGSDGKTMQIDMDKVTVKLMKEKKS